MNIDVSSLAQFTSWGSSGVQASSRVGAAASISLKTGDAGSFEDSLSAFAAEMSNRLTGAAQDEQGQDKDASGLVSSLTSTVRWMKDRYGDDAATAAMGMILGSTQAGATEDSLSDGLLKTLRMVDNNFGFDAGDAAISRFNGSLNNEINAFFDNGQTERFMAVDLTEGQDGSGGLNLNSQALAAAVDSAVSQMAANLADKIGDSGTASTDPTQALLDSLAQQAEDQTPAEPGTATASLPGTLEESLGQTMSQFSAFQTSALQGMRAQAAYGYVPPAQAAAVNMAV